MKRPRAVFLDRDGVLNEILYFEDMGRIDTPFTVAQFKLRPGAAEAVARLNRLGYKTVVVSNQPGIARNNYSEETLAKIDAKMREQLGAGGGVLDASYYCKHHPDGANQKFRLDCGCRKPKPGLLLRAAKDLDLDLSGSYLIGDGLNDVEAGNRAGCKTILLGRQKCDLCRFLEDKGLKPGWIVPDLKEAVDIIERGSEAGSTMAKAIDRTEDVILQVRDAAQLCGFLEREAKLVVAIAERIAEALRQGKKVLVLGNGGSAADAQHIAAELAGRQYMDRDSLPAIALTTNSSSVTAIANDYGYDTIFAHQLRGLAREGDVVFALSAGGNSPNVVLAIEEAKRRKAVTIGFTGKEGGKLKELADYALHVPSKDTARIQEVHMLAGHLICGMIEQLLFGPGAAAPKK